MNKVKIDWATIVFLFLLVSAIVLLGNVYRGMKSDGGKCIASPFVYGAEKFQEKFRTGVYGTVVIEEHGTMGFNSTTMIPGERWLPYVQ